MNRRLSIQAERIVMRFKKFEFDTNCHQLFMGAIIYEINKLSDRMKHAASNTYF